MSEFHNLPFTGDFGCVFRHVADAANKGDSIFKRATFPGYQQFCQCQKKTLIFLPVFMRCFDN